MGTKVTVKATVAMVIKRVIVDMAKIMVMDINTATINTTEVMATNTDTNMDINTAGTTIKTEDTHTVDTIDLTIGHTTDPTLIIQDPIQFIPMHLFQLT